MQLKPLATHCRPRSQVTLGRFASTYNHPPRGTSDHHRLVDKNITNKTGTDWSLVFRRASSQLPFAPRTAYVYIPHSILSTTITTLRIASGTDKPNHLLSQPQPRQQPPATMSFDQLSSLEAGRRRNTGDNQYTDDPEFQRLSQELMNKLFKLNGNNQRLQGEVSHLGTRRDTPRVRERVHELIEESRDLFKEVGGGVKKVQTWEDVTVRYCSLSLSYHHSSSPPLPSAGP